MSAIGFRATPFRLLVASCSSWKWKQLVPSLSAPSPLPWLGQFSIEFLLSCAHTDTHLCFSFLSYIFSLPLFISFFLLSWISGFDAIFSSFSHWQLKPFFFPTDSFRIHFDRVVVAIFAPIPIELVHAAITTPTLHCSFFSNFSFFFQPSYLFGATTQTAFVLIREQR